MRVSALQFAAALCVSGCTEQHQSVTVLAVPGVWCLVQSHCNAKEPIHGYSIYV